MTSEEKRTYRDSTGGSTSEMRPVIKAALDAPDDSPLRKALETLLPGAGMPFSFAISHVVCSEGYGYGKPDWTDYIPREIEDIWETMSLNERLLVLLFAQEKFNRDSNGTETLDKAGDFMAER